MMKVRKKMYHKMFVMLTISISMMQCMHGILAEDLSSDREALLVLRNALGGRLLLWNLSSVSPCTWTGVYCTDNHVTKIQFPGMGLSGQLPAGVLGNLTSLHTISLRFNSLTGALPHDLVNLSNLRYLYLQGNFFSGDIPHYLFRLGNLMRLNLAYNNFSGGISGEFDRLTRLGSLFLEHNSFSGSVPDLKLPSLQQFNVSFNQLTGSVPLSFSGMPRSSFEGNSLCGKPLESCVKEGGGKRRLSILAIAGIVVGSVVAVLVIVWILVVVCRRGRSGVGKKDALEGGKSGAEETCSSSAPETAEAGKTGDQKGLVFLGEQPARTYDFETLLRASARVLGKGTFGTSYKAILDMGIVVAVKTLKDVMVSELEFRQKMKTLGAMNHENLVPLRSYYCSGDEKILVYDYMPMGSLSALLHGSARTPLNWEMRTIIALGAARGVAYLHSVSPETSHGNIKSSNVLLSTSYEARVSDFGLAQLAIPTSNTNHNASYRAPEVTNGNRVSQKADVYSFGLFLMELLTGRALINSSLDEEGIDLPRWVQSFVKEEWAAKVFDIELCRYQNVENVVQLLQLALDCTVQYPDSRPSMAEVASRIEELCPGSPQEIDDIL